MSRYKVTMRLKLGIPEWQEFVVYAANGKDAEWLAERAHAETIEDHAVKVEMLPDVDAPTVELTAAPAPAGFPGDLRDWFAGQALVGMLANSAITEHRAFDRDGCASESYHYAAAMLAAREEADRG